MADKKLSEMNWKDRIEAGKPLNPLQDVQATADFNFTQRQEEQKAREEFEARKRGYTVASDGADTTADGSDDTSNDNGKKGNK